MKYGLRRFWSEFDPALPHGQLDTLGRWGAVAFLRLGVRVTGFDEKDCLVSCNDWCSQAVPCLQWVGPSLMLTSHR